MKSGLFGTLAMLFGAGWAAAQGPAPVNNPASPPYYANAGAAPVGTISTPPNMSNPVLGNSAVPSNSAAPGLSGAVHGCSADDTYSAYFSADYLLWRVRNGAIPATATAVPVGLISVDTSNLVTNNPAAPAVPGGTPTVGFAPVSIASTSRFGATSTDYGDQCGFRLTGGFWCDADMSCGFEGSLFLLDRGSDRFAAVAAVSGNQFILNTGFNRSLFLVQGTAQTQLATFPIFAVRESTAQTFGTASNSLGGGELNARSIGLRFGCVDIGGLVGARYILFKDELSVTNQVRLFRPAGFPLTAGDASASLSSDLTFNTADRVRIANHFIGGHAGAEIDAKFGSFFINSRFKFGVGTILQDARVESQTRIINNDTGVGLTPPGRVTSGGLLAGPNDVGDHERNRFGFLAEVNLKIGYLVTESCRAYVGYDGLYLGHMARAGLSSVTNSLNTTINVPGGNVNNQVSAPAFRFREQDIFVRGLTAGVEFRY